MREVVEPDYWERSAGHCVLYFPFSFYARRMKVDFDMSSLECSVLKRISLGCFFQTIRSSMKLRVWRCVQLVRAPATAPCDLQRCSPLTSLGLLALQLTCCVPRS